MTSAQKRRIEAARQEGGTLTHRTLGNGSLLLTHTIGGVKHHAVIDVDGEYVNTVESRIYTAYLALAPRDQAWVSLLRLRRNLKDSRRSIDAALLALYRAGDAYLVPESNRRALTEHHHAAAIQAGEPKHLVAFPPEYDPVK